MKDQINTDKNLTINGLHNLTLLIKQIKVAEKLTERPDEIDKNVVISNFAPVSKKNVTSKERTSMKERWK